MGTTTGTEVTNSLLTIFIMEKRQLYKLKQLIFSTKQEVSSYHRSYQQVFQQKCGLCFFKLEVDI